MRAEVLAALVKANRKARSIPPSPQPVPRDQWPAWASAIAALRKPGEIGVGDTIKNRLGEPGKAYQAAWKMLGMPCRCPERRGRFNRLYPYPAANNTIEELSHGLPTEQSP